jgi:hypothetical protein
MISIITALYSVMKGFHRFRCYCTFLRLCDTYKYEFLILSEEKSIFRVDPEVV